MIDCETSKVSLRDQAIQKKIDRLESALQVIYTWATFEDGIELVPKHVADLIDKTLGRK